MYLKLVLIFAGYLSLVQTTTSTPNSFQTLFPEQNKLYSYQLVTNVTTGTLTPIQDGSYWTLEGRLSVQVYDDFGRARFTLDDIKTLVYSKHGSSTHHSAEAVDFLKKPWEVGVCFSSIHVDTEPVWVTNMKRALSFNFLLAEPRGSPSNSEEPCLYGNCVVIYSRVGNKTRKYNSLVDERRNKLSSYEQRCLPNRSSESWYRPTYSEDPSYVMSSERVYQFDERVGLTNLEMSSDFQYRTHDHLLSVSSQLILRYEADASVQSIRKLILTETSLQYVSQDHSNPTNGIRNLDQNLLRTKTYDILLKIARTGIDANNIVRNASLIHSLDFVEILNSMSQLNYTSLRKLYTDVLGTSYELETARNIFLEVLPYVRTDACAQLIRHLVVDQKTKIEDAVLISLIRKLPYNLANYNRGLLEELEVFTKLGPDYSQEIRHAGILSFATLVHKTMEASFDQQYFDEIYDKYLRMYNYCPQYLDRLVWLQGLTNIGKSVVNYLDEIHTDTKKDRHERLWAALASLSIWKGSTLENTLPILMNETEHIQLRITALHAFLSTPLSARDFLNVHNYLKRCNNNQLKRFWYTTVKSLENNRFYNRYKAASYYIPFVANQVTNPDSRYWGTSNYIISQEPTLDIQGPTFQLLTVGEAWSGPPEMMVVEFSTGGEQSYNAAIYITAEGVTSNVFKRFQNFNSTDRTAEGLLSKLKQIKVEILQPEKVHIDIVLKIYDKTVYATHVDQARFDSWNFEDSVRKSIEDFVRFGSHINQQIVYYPIQMVKDFPTELGTPITLQSTVVSFTSLRGNLTTPSSSEDLTWRNDLHIRYQGTAVTSLSTDGPLQPSEHSARIQQSMVIHLPIKFDISFSPLARSLELKWTNPAQNGGMAMHSRTQVGIDSETRKFYTVSARKKYEDENGIFFDCDNPIPMPGFEVSQLLTSRNYNFLTSLQPSHIILNSIRLITSPTSGSCGLILPPSQLQTGNKLDLEVKLDELEWDEDDDTKRQNYWTQTKLKVSYGLNYYREPDDKYLSIGGYTKVNSDGRIGTVTMVLNSQQSHAVDPAVKNWTICLQEKHNISASIFDRESKSNPSYEGHIYLNFSSGDDFSCFSENESSKMVVDIASQVVDLVRYLRIKILGEKIPVLDLETSNLVRQSDLSNLVDSVNEKTPHFAFYSYEVTKNPQGVESANINATVEMEIEPKSVDWLPDNWASLRMMKNLGVYHECRLQGSKIRTFSGSTAELPPWQETLAVADCTDNPRFAVLLSHRDSGMTVHTGSDYITYSWPNAPGPMVTVRSDQQVNDFRETTNSDDDVLLRSRLTGIHVYHNRHSETVVLVPHAYMGTVCGACVGQNNFIEK